MSSVRLPDGSPRTDVRPGVPGRIGKPAEGYRYGTIDGDAVKLVVGTLLVVDAIEGLVE